jgi:hypothetical protein
MIFYLEQREGDLYTCKADGLRPALLVATDLTRLFPELWRSICPRLLAESRQATEIRKPRYAGGQFWLFIMRLSARYFHRQGNVPCWV